MQKETKNTVFCWPEIIAHTPWKCSLNINYRFSSFGCFSLSFSLDIILHTENPKYSNIKINLYLIISSISHLASAHASNDRPTGQGKAKKKLMSRGQRCNTAAKRDWQNVQLFFFLFISALAFFCECSICIRLVHIYRVLNGNGSN